MLNEFVTNILAMLLGYAYPAFECFKMMEIHQVNIEKFRFWCQYWVIIAIVTIFERFFEIFVSWLPLYAESKLAFFIYLWHPKTQGTSWVYAAFLRPLVAEHESEIEDKLKRFRAKSGELLMFYIKNFTDQGKSMFLELVHLVVQQPTLSSSSVRSSSGEPPRPGEPSAPPYASPARPDSTHQSTYPNPARSSATNQSPYSDHNRANTTNQSPYPNPARHNATNQSPYPNQTGPNATHQSPYPNQTGPHATHQAPYPNPTRPNATHQSPYPNPATANTTHQPPPPFTSDTNTNEINLNQDIQLNPEVEQALRASGLNLPRFRGNPSNRT